MGARARLLLAGAGAALAVSALGGWYVTGPDQPGPRLGVSGWDAGALGKLVCAAGIVLALLGLVWSRLPAILPWPTVTLALAALAGIAVVVRLLSVPEAVLPATGRGTGIWVSLAASAAAGGASLLLALAELGPERPGPRG